MNLEYLRRGLYGYTAESVFTYILDREATFARILAERDAHIAELEEKLRSLEAGTSSRKPDQGE